MKTIISCRKKKKNKLELHNLPVFLILAYIIFSQLSIRMSSELTLTEMLNNMTTTEMEKTKQILNTQGDLSSNGRIRTPESTPPILNAQTPNEAKSKDFINSLRQSNELTKLLITQNAPFQFQAWVKYFHYTPSSGKPNMFFVNPRYNTRAEKNEKLKDQEDEFGPFLLPTRTSFFAVVQEDKVNILESRVSGMSSFSDVMNIELLGRIPDDAPLQGSVKNFGLVQEGYCFKIESYIPKHNFEMTFTHPDPKDATSDTEFWIFCLEDQEKKEKMMLWVIKSKLQMQSKVGFHLFLHKDDNDSSSNQPQTNAVNSTAPKKSNENQKEIDKAPFQTKEKADCNVATKSSNDIRAEESRKLGIKITDGHWEILKNWGQCSLQCGGGMQFQQLICIPPKNGGKPCLGKSVRTRLCNTQPCPAELPHQQQNIINVQPPLIKILPLSNKPLRYELCIVKESDCLMRLADVNSIDASGGKDLNPNYRPVRLIMNKNSIIVVDLSKMNLDTEDLATPPTLPTIQSYNINKTDIIKLGEIGKTENSMIAKNERAKCFKLISPGGKGVFCGVDNPIFGNEWEKDVKIFKFACTNSRKALKFRYDLDSKNSSSPAVSKVDGECLDSGKQGLVENGLTEKEKGSLRNDYKKKFEEAKQEIIHLREKSVKAKAKSSQKQSLLEQQEAATLKALSSFGKEFKLEDLVQQEELAKEQSEIKELKSQITKESKRRELLLKRIKEKESEEQFNVEKKRSSKKIEEENAKMRERIQKKREEIKQKIMIMRKRNERRKEMLKHQLKLIRTEASTQVLRATKRDHYFVCYNEKNQNSAFAKAFCHIYVNDEDTLQKLFDCEAVETFCQSCCELMIGELNVVDRDDCYDKCDDLKTSGEAKTEVSSSNTVPEVY